MRLIIFRHGDRFKDTGERSGDGPLTPAGEHRVRASAEDLRVELESRHMVGNIDFALVSGSIRCAETFAIIWKQLHMHSRIRILNYEMDKQFFSTPSEDAGWNKLYHTKGKLLRKDIERLGEKTAVMRHAGPLVMRCVIRTLARLDEVFNLGAERVLLVTHAPHDALIAGHFTKVKQKTCLEVGRYRIIDSEG